MALPLWDGAPHMFGISQLETALVRGLHRLGARRLHQLALTRFWQYDPDARYVVKLIEADVDSVTHTHAFPFAVRGKHAVLGVLDGDWDLMTIEFTRTQLFTSIEMRIRRQANWADTPFYQKQYAKIISGKKGENNCQSLSDLNAHCASINRCISIRSFR